MTDEKQPEPLNYSHAKFLQRKKDHLDLQINYRIQDGALWTATFRMDRIDLDSLIRDLRMARFIQDGKTINEADELAETTNND